MDGGDRWRVIRCIGSAQDRTIINPMMLRFRPIAPKPTTGNTSVGSSPTEIKNSMFTNSRTKRKYVRVKKTSAARTRRRRLSDQERESEDTKRENIVTLQLLPERTDGDKQPSSGGSRCNRVDLNNTVKEFAVEVSDRAVEWWLTVESVTDACNHAGGIGSTDCERMKNLEMDTCPVLVSDNLNRVQWLNGAFKRMVTTTENGRGLLPEIVVWLATKEKPRFHSFTCQMRMQYTWREHRCSKLVPCDGWRMDSGGFAWRLDLKAALGLGL